MTPDNLLHILNWLFHSQRSLDVATELFRELHVIYHHPNDTGERFSRFMDRIERMGYKEEDT